MTPEQLARVRFLVREDGWAEWTRLHPPAAPTPEQPAPVPGAALLDMALAEYRDLRLVAAYVLETVCSEARQVASELVAQTKRIKVGPIEIEKATNTANRLTVQADDWCGRAKALRDGVEYERNTTQRRMARTAALPLEVNF